MRLRRGLQGRRRNDSEPQPAAWGRTPRRALPSASRPVKPGRASRRLVREDGERQEMPDGRVPDSGAVLREQRDRRLANRHPQPAATPGQSRRSPTATSAGATWSRREPAGWSGWSSTSPRPRATFTPLSICLNVDSFEHLDFETRPDQLIVYTLVEGDEGSSRVRAAPRSRLGRACGQASWRFDTSGFVHGAARLPGRRGRGATRRPDRTAPGQCPAVLPGRRGCRAGRRGSALASTYGRRAGRPRARRSASTTSGENAGRPGRSGQASSSLRDVVRGGEQLHLDESRWCRTPAGLAAGSPEPDRGSGAYSRTTLSSPSTSV